MHRGVHYWGRQNSISRARKKRWVGTVCGSAEDRRSGVQIHLAYSERPRRCVACPCCDSSSTPRARAWLDPRWHFVVPPGATSCGHYRRAALSGIRTPWWSFHLWPHARKTTAVWLHIFLIYQVGLHNSRTRTTGGFKNDYVTGPPTRASTADWKPALSESVWTRFGPSW